MILKILILIIILTTSSAYAANIGTSVVKLNTNIKMDEVVKSAMPPTILIQGGYRCNTSSGASVQGQYIGLGGTLSSESKTCVSEMLAGRFPRDPKLQHALRCQIKQYRYANEALNRDCPRRKFNWWFKRKPAE